MNSEINQQWVYQQSPAEVWEYLTQAELIEVWLMPNNFKAVIGHEFEFRTKPKPDLDLDGIFHCKVLQLIPYEKLVYSWKGGPGDGSILLDTIVEWTLEPHGDGTRLLLNHSGFKETNFSLFTGMTAGWQSNIQKMFNHLINHHHGNTNS